jgi:hypothetical protein
VIRSNDVVLLQKRIRERRDSQHPNLSVDQFFLIDSAESLLREFDPSTQQVEDGIVDGADDGGIDAVYLAVNGKLVDEADETASDGARIEILIIQAKNESGFGESALQKLKDHLPVLLDLEADDKKLAQEFNSEVVERFGLIRRTWLALSDGFPQVRIAVYYAANTDAEPNVKVQQKAKRLETEISRLGVEDATVEFVDAKRLNELARARVPLTLSLRLAQIPLSSPRGGLIALAALSAYHELVSTDDGRLRDSIFEENVRGFEGQTAINREIARTLSHGAEDSLDFWWLNNGVTITARQVTNQQNTLRMLDPQIVNGLQTSRAIYDHFRANPTVPDDDRHILLRVIETSDEDTSARVIKATNSQNRVPASSLRAGDSIQKKIEQFFTSAGYFYERRRNYYKGLGKRRDRIVEVKELAQAVGAVLLQRPDDSRGRPSSFLRDREYNRIFSDQTPLAAYLNCYLLVVRVDEYLLSAGMKSRIERGNFKYHVARSSAAFALASSRPKARAMATLPLDGFTDERLARALEFVQARRNVVAKRTGVSDDSTLAKGKEWVDEIDRYFSMVTNKQSWPKKMWSGWAVKK